MSSINIVCSSSLSKLTSSSFSPIMSTSTSFPFSENSSRSSTSKPDAAAIAKTPSSFSSLSSVFSESTLEFSSSSSSGSDSSESTPINSKRIIRKELSYCRILPLYSAQSASAFDQTIFTASLRSFEEAPLLSPQSLNWDDRIPPHTRAKVLKAFSDCSSSSSSSPFSKSSSSTIRAFCADPRSKINSLISKSSSSSRFISSFSTISSAYPHLNK
mmetsp:Transcript_10062/g.11490  ORF Transcript_10062/g.11490 Transcript_10062/m.11490 type:complete len:215 (+) Transcript_10062:1309-1953(+)